MICALILKSNFKKKICTLQYRIAFCFVKCHRGRIIFCYDFSFKSSVCTSYAPYLIISQWVTCVCFLCQLKLWAFWIGARVKMTFPHSVRDTVSDTEFTLGECLLSKYILCNDCNNDCDALHVLIAVCQALSPSKYPVIKYSLSPPNYTWWPRLTR